jgi:hypothetical protein
MQNVHGCKRLLGGWQVGQSSELCVVISKAAVELNIVDAISVKV